jgi:beta-galactosidase/beta-glucuronidase
MTLEATPCYKPGALFRQALSLDGRWDFTFQGPTVRLEGGNHHVRSPGVWQSQIPSLRNAHGLGRYRRRVDIPENWAGKRIVLLMEGVFHESEILVDGARVASHRDGWTPIEVDLTDALAGKAGFELGIDASTPDDRDSGRFSQSLVAKQDWYGVQGGIWKPARLEARDPLHIAGAAVATAYDLAMGTLTIKGTLSQAGDATLRLTLTRGGKLAT